ncbi:helix-turn-helix domain-containing protein [Aeromonas veronii]|uniref:Cro/CI family transcriptional regulator n=1 Tax=Aeromonas TaxID=642 RepID=UPI0022EB8A6A|nr:MULTISPECIES: Cro/CI family transcriptional regulator [Aeromonas]KAJ8740022.1 helix-turn-helix domain-containing protein [Aeromonas veronii]MDA3317838.1 Cro/CI family transcriptional regulator [Aeromonas sp. PI_26]
MKKADVLEHFGGGSKVARALGISAATVSCWGEVIPKGRAYEIEVLTGGALKAGECVRKATATAQEQPGEA